LLQRALQSLFITLQRILPVRLIGRGVYAITRTRSYAVKTLLIRAFVRLYKVDMSEAANPAPAGYESFNAFFTRALKPGARPLDPDPETIISPADGTIQQIGRLRGEQILQVKGISYSAVALLGGEQELASPYRDGLFATIYLAPRDYHRVHVPVAGRIARMTHVPGELWAVNAITTARVKGLFARNERLICHFQARWGCFAVVLVGALNVGSISTAWAGEVLPRRTRQMAHWDYPAGDATTGLARGALLGQFNMGSTVVLLLPAGTCVWHEDLAAGANVRAGMALGRLTKVRAAVP
jgi:phosphatidylserine decarboxylase